MQRYEGRVVRFRFLKHFYLATNFRITRFVQKVPQLLIVDGQQRLTSLYAVVRGQPVINADYEKERIEITFRPTDTTFEVTDAAIRKDPEFITSISAMWKDYEGSYSFITAYITN